MNLGARLHRLHGQVMRRRCAILALVAIPLSVAIFALAARIGGAVAALVVALLALAVVAVFAWRAWRGIDEVWLARRLDASAAQMDDSAALLFLDATALSELQRLQQARVRARLAEVDVDLRPAWPWSRLYVAFAAALALLLGAALWQPPAYDGGDANQATINDAAKATALRRTQIEIEAPGYTQVSPRSETALDAKAPEGSRLRWTLRFDPEPRAAALVFHDGRRVALAREGDDWRGELLLGTSTLYRVALEGAPPPADDRLHRLDAIPDRAPEVRVLEPEKTLTLLEAQQKNWNLVFEADDDYGIASAELQVTLAQGGGENITFKEQTIALTPASLTTPSAARTLQPLVAASTSFPASRERDGSGPYVRYRYAHTLDLASLGLSMGDDVIVRAIVTDNREPKPNTTRSASFILRWPAEASNDSAALEGVVQKTMPAYFRSQRQIIIDSEALLAERAKVDDKTFLDRSDAIGVDQKVLRLRYGQFLGEESETHAQHADAQEQAEQSAHEEGEAEHHEHTDAHATQPATFGKEGDIVAEYGHVHDIAEAATLLDPETKATLKSALAEMWQAELHLRQGKPDEALPYEYRALEFIKQVQQSTRIYLARVGLELPAPDEARRLSGERKGVDDRTGSLAAATDDAATIAQLWRSLESGAAPDWSEAETWLRARAANVPDALGMLTAIDRARRDPACTECRAALRGLLWPLLPTPASANAPRAAPNESGRVYLDALQAGEAAAQ